MQYFLLKTRIRHLVLVLVIFLIHSCKKDEEADLQYYFRGTINGEFTEYVQPEPELDLGTRGGRIFQGSRLGSFFGADAAGIAVTFYFTQEPTAERIQSLQGKSLPFDCQGGDCVVLTLFDGPDPTDNESSNDLVQPAESFFEILEVSEDDGYQPAFPGFEGRAFAVRGRTAFRTASATVEEAEFRVRLLDEE